VSEWEEFTAYAGIIADAKREERERIIKLLGEKNDYLYDVEVEYVIELIKGENK